MNSDSDAKVEESGMTDEELVKALEQIDALSNSPETPKMPFDVASLENDRSEYIDSLGGVRGVGSKLIPPVRVAFTKSLGIDGKMHSIQVTNPAKKALKKERARKKLLRKKT